MHDYNDDTSVSYYQGRFSRDQELESSLVIVNKKICRRGRHGKPPREGEPPALPGHPTRVLEASRETDIAIAAFLKDEFVTPKLNLMAPHLWLVATPRHSNVSPLHEQVLRGRRLIITENPELHLAWIDDKVFIKPIPKYLMSHAFWERYLDSNLLLPYQNNADERLLPPILGYLRSWTFLVRHESDFILAKEAHLISQGIQYARFMKFVSNFSPTSVMDDDVNPRYRYGQLRLSRLNMWARVFLPDGHFQQVYWQYWEYFQTFYAPLLFIFAVFTVVLSAMQVGLTAPDIWPPFISVSVYFSVITLFIVATTAIALLFRFLSMGLREVVFAVRAVIRGKRSSP